MKVTDSIDLSRLKRDKRNTTGILRFGRQGARGGSRMMKRGDKGRWGVVVRIFTRTGASGVWLSGGSGRRSGALQGAESNSGEGGHGSKR